MSEEVRVYSQSEYDAVCTRLAKCKERFFRVYREVYKIQPWTESNDMDALDEVLCGLGLIQQTIEELRSSLAVQSQ